MKKSILLLLCMAFACMLQASFLENVPKTIIQPNGLVVAVFVSGDEFYQWAHDKDGNTIVLNNESRYWEYAVLNEAEDDLIPTGIKVGIDNPDAKAFFLNTRIPVKKILQLRLKSGFDAALQRAHKNRKSANVGAFNNIVILIRFSNEDEYEEPASYMYSMFNEEGDYAISMKQYYKEMSYNQLFITSHIFPAPNENMLVSYQDEHPRNYYLPESSVNTIGYKDEDERKQREHMLLKRAIEAVDPEIDNSLNVDYDNDGMVDNVCFIVKGDTWTWGSLMWPHKWTLSSYDVYINGKKVHDYNFNISGDDNFNVGTLSHEMFHTFGAPDLYNYTATSIVNPVGNWDLMSTASMEIPKGIGAYMREKYGKWTTLPIISNNGAYELYPLSRYAADAPNQETETAACKIMTDNEDGQFFVVEYRKREGWDITLPGEGLLIYRIDPRFDGNMYPDHETVFNEIYVYRPDGTRTVNGYPDQAAFGNQEERSFFHGNSNPQAFFNGSGIDQKIHIYNIGEPATTLSFDFSYADVNLSLSMDEVRADCLEREISVTVNTSHDSWAVMEKSPWITCSPAEGKNGDVVTISLLQNQTKYDREATLSFTSLGATVSLPVYQSAYDPSVVNINAVGASMNMVYPNPVSNLLYVKTEEGKMAHVKLYSVDGHLLLQTTVSDYVDLSDYPAGAYIVNINGEIHKVLKR